MTQTTLTPTANAAVWGAASAALYAGDLDGFLTHWRPDAQYEVAYPVPGLPPVVAGHAELRALFAGFGTMAAAMRVEDVRYHATVDPDCAFVEQRLVAELHDGSTYENRMCLRVRFEDGRIASVFEYYGELAHRDLLRRVGLAA